MRAILLLLIFCCSAYCKNWWIGPSASGDSSGSDSNNLKAISFFNSSPNWNGGSSTISTGDVAYLYGTFGTNSAATFYGHGSQASPITISLKYCLASGDFWFSGFLSPGGAPNWIVIDGEGTGIIEATNNGAGLGYTNFSYGINLSSPYFSNWEVKNLIIRNQFVTSPGDSTEKGYGVYSGMSSTTNVSVHNCTISNCWIGVGTFYLGSSAILSHYSNTIYGCDIGVSIGQGDVNSFLTNCYVWANTIDNNGLWDGNWTAPPGDGHHHNSGIHVFANDSGGTGSTIYNARIYRNTIGPNLGTNATAHINPEGHVNCAVYNNVLLGNAADGSYPNVGFIDFKEAYPPQTNLWQCYNNSILGSSGSGIALYFTGGTNIFCLNNAAWRPNIFIYIPDANTGLIQFDYNDCFGAVNYAFATNALKTFAQWQAFGYDANSITNYPSWNSSLVPSNSSPLIDIGTNVSSVFTVDFSSILRPEGSAWDIGAYEFVSGGGSPVMVAYPSPLAFGTISRARTSPLSITVSNAGTGTLSGNATSDSANFPVTSGSGYSIGAGTAGSVEVTFKPLGIAGNYSGNVTLTGGGQTNIPMTGSATNFPTAVLQGKVTTKGKVVIQ